MCTAMFVLALFMVLCVSQTVVGLAEVFVSVRKFFRKRRHRRLIRPAAIGSGTDSSVAVPTFVDQSIWVDARHSHWDSTEVSFKEVD